MGYLWQFDHYLEGESLFAFRLPADDDDTNTTEQSQNDTGHNSSCMPGHQLWETLDQDDAQYSDKNGCREKTKREKVTWRYKLLYICVFLTGLAAGDRLYLQASSQTYSQIIAVVA